MVLSLQAFTTPSNTEVIADTAAAPGTLPTAAVFTTPAQPAIDENMNYIWSPNVAPGQEVTFLSSFRINTGAIGLALPVSVYYLFAGNSNVTVTSASIQILDVLGIVIATIPLSLSGNNGSNPNNVVTLAADTLLGIQLLANALTINVTATVIAPNQGSGSYLGEIIVREIV